MIHSALPDDNYQDVRVQGAEIVKSWKSSLSAADAARLDGARIPLAMPRGDYRDYRVQQAIEEYLGKCKDRELLALGLIKDMVKANHPVHPMSKAGGVTTASGFNFYDLRAPVMLIVPVNTPMRAQIANVGPVNAGVGIAANWNAITDMGIVYGGVSEGNRGGVMTPNRVPYIATYKEVASESEVTLTAQFAGEGYVDNLAGAHQRSLFGLWLQEEGMIWMGNSGSGVGANGFQFNGTSNLTATPTPTCSAVTTHTVGSAGNLSNLAGADLPYTAALTNTQYVSVAVVLLTGMGNPANRQYGYGTNPSITNSLTTTWSRTNADGSKDTIPGGMSAISAVSTPCEALSGGSLLTIKASIPPASLPVKGCFGYAWFVDVESSNTGSLGAAKLAGITTVPYCYISGTPTGTQLGTASGLSNDNSYNPLDFDGLFSNAINYSNKGINPSSYGWTDLYGASLTSQKNGRVTEIENILLTIYQTWQAGVDELWMSADAAENLDAAIRWNGTQASGMQIFFTRDQLNNLIGGFVVAGYQSRFETNSPTGGKVLPIRIHPMIPPGTIYFHVKTNPYPQSEIPFTVGMMLQRDYYSIEYPQTSRRWTFGTYRHQALAHMLPGFPWVLTGIGPFSVS
jgi:hypothetical protein